MTENQVIYIVNTKRSVALCTKMELLVEQIDYYQKLSLQESYHISVIELHELRIELDELWNEQVDLFFKIQDEYKIKKRATVMDAFRLLAKRPKTHE